MKKITASGLATKRYAEGIGKTIKSGRIFALWGDLGSGKTTFVKGLARGLGLNHKIKSPTFVIFHSYPIPKTFFRFYHFDLYRLRSAAELEDLGFPEIIKNRKNIVAIEWPKIAKKFLPANTKHINFTHVKKQPKNRIIESL